LKKSHFDMKKSFISLLFLTAFSHAQVGIGTGTGVLTNTNLLKVQDDNTKGVVLTRNTSDFRVFPRYNVNAIDLFDDYPNLTGSIIYNTQDDQYYKYDGYAWNPARQTQAIYNPMISRIGATSGFTKLCLGFVGGLCLAGDPPVFKMADNPSAVLVDNLVVKNSSNFVRITDAGVYDLVSAVNINGLSLGAQAAIKEYKLSMQARTAGSNDEWKTIAQKKSYTVILLLNAAGADTSFVHTAYIPANTELRVMVEISTTGADVGQIGGATTDLDPNKTYFAVRKVR